MILRLACRFATPLPDRPLSPASSVFIAPMMR